MNNKGINLIALVIMIIVMIIVASIAYKNSFDAQEKAMVARNKEERMNVTHAIQNRFGEYVTNGTISPLSGVIIPEENDTIDKMYEYIKMYLKTKGKLSTDEREEFENDIMNLLKENKDNLEYTRVLEHSHLLELGVENLPTDAMYVVNYYGMTVVGPIY